jgi:dihydroorotate dehydrogenase (fumarate)
MSDDLITTPFELEYGEASVGKPLIDLTTDYMGLKLKHPIVPGASPLCDDLDMVRRLEDAGAPAIIMHSLFEEQIISEQMQAHAAIEGAKEVYAEALSHLPEPEEFHLGPEQYLEQIARIKRAVHVPCIASLNGTTIGGWLDYAKQIEQAGADALELNVYDLAADPDESSADCERRIVELVTEVDRTVQIPLAVKIAPYYTGLAHFARRLSDAGADALVMFNRLYQPEIDVEELELIRVNPVGLGEMTLRLRWLGLLWGRFNGHLAASGGFSSPIDVVKGLMAGATVVQVVSTLLLNGPEHLHRLREGLRHWLEEHEYDSLDQLRGSMSMQRCPDPSAYTRANYMRTLLSWRL